MLNIKSNFPARILSHNVSKNIIVWSIWQIFPTPITYWDGYMSYIYQLFHYDNANYFRLPVGKHLTILLELWTHTSAPRSLIGDWHCVWDQSDYCHANKIPLFEKASSVIIKTSIMLQNSHLIWTVTVEMAMRGYKFLRSGHYHSL